jgi:hypothetical protein
VIEQKEPAGPRHGIVNTEHICRAQHVIDGHHELAAAADLGQEISVLQFTSIMESAIASDLFDQLKDDGWEVET